MPISHSIDIISIGNKNERFPVHLYNAAKNLGANFEYDVSDGILGQRKLKLLEKSSSEWILILDTDEDPSRILIQEITKIVGEAKFEYNGYWIPYKNYAFGGAVLYGGEKYSKLRLFRRKYGSVAVVPIHEEIIVRGRIGRLSGHINHNSFRNPWQVFRKFSWYAWLVAGEKRKAGEKVTLKKLTMYAPHMFWARAIKDQGWRDGWRGILLALFFAYMEGLTYWLLLLRYATRR